MSTETSDCLPIPSLCGNNSSKNPKPGKILASNLSPWFATGLQFISAYPVSAKDEHYCYFREEVTAP